MRMAILALAAELTRNGRSTNKFDSYRSAINHRQENHVHFATTTIVEVSLQGRVQNVVANYRQGCRNRSFLLVRFRSLTMGGYCHLLINLAIYCLVC